MSGRDEVLRSIRSSLAAARLPSGMTPAAASGPDRRAASSAAGPEAVSLPEPDRAAIAESFMRELTAAGGIVHGPMSSGDAAGVALGILGEAGSKRGQPGAQPGPQVIAWSDDQLAVPGLGEALRRDGYAFGATDLPRDPKPRTRLLRELAEAGVGLTGADAGIADTGSLALSSGPGRPRLAWLLPPVHVAFLPLTALHPDMASFFARNPEKPIGSANVVFVTGPSRTADIELILTRGVHGPKELHVVLLR